MIYKASRSCSICLFESCNTCRHFAAAGRDQAPNGREFNGSNICLRVQFCASSSRSAVATAQQSVSMARSTKSIFEEVSGVGKRSTDMLHSIIDETQFFSVANSPAQLRKEQQEWRRKLSLSTDVTKNDADPYGDGVQSSLKHYGLPGEPAQELVNIWSGGCELGGLFQHWPPQPDLYGVSYFCLCAFGNAMAVGRFIEHARSLGPDVLRKVLEKRETTLRMSPLQACIAGSRYIGKGIFPRSIEAMQAHFETATLLVEAGPMF